MIIKTDSAWQQVKHEQDYLNSLLAFLTQEANNAAMTIQKDKHNIGAQNVLLGSKDDIEMMVPIIGEMRASLYGYLMTKYPQLKGLKNPNLNIKIVKENE